MHTHHLGSEPAPRHERFWPSMTPTWWLRVQLKSTEADIERLESLLCDEFAVSETAPMHAELERLRGEESATRVRLLGRT